MIVTRLHEAYERGYQTWRDRNKYRKHKEQPCCYVSKARNSFAQQSLRNRRKADIPDEMLDRRHGPSSGSSKSPGSSRLSHATMWMEIIINDTSSCSQVRGSHSRLPACSFHAVPPLLPPCSLRSGPHSISRPGTAPRKS